MTDEAEASLELREAYQDGRLEIGEYPRFLREPVYIDRELWGPGEPCRDDITYDKPQAPAAEQYGPKDSPLYRLIQMRSVPPE